MVMIKDDMSSSQWLSQAVVPLELLAELGASNFDTLYVRNSSISTVIEVVSRRRQLQILDSKEEDGDEAVDKDSKNGYEMDMHPILAEILVVASMETDEENDSEGSHVLANNASTLLNVDTASKSTTAYIGCIHEEILYRSPFTVSLVPDHKIYNIFEEGLQTKNKCVVKAKIFPLGFTNEDIEIFRDSEWIQERLEGRVIKEGSILTLDLPFDIVSRDRDEHKIVMLEIEEIKTFQISGIDRENSKDSTSHREEDNCRESLQSPLFYRLVQPESYTLNINVEEFDEGQVHEDLFDDQVQIDENTFWAGAGYENLLNELIQLTSIHDRKAATSGVLLTGPSGVGKSSIAQTLIQTISSRAYQSPHRKVLYHRVSARNILLSASTMLSNPDQLLPIIIPPAFLKTIQGQYILLETMMKEHGFDSRTKNSQSLHLHLSRVVLIIDDIDILLQANGDDTDSSPFSDMERSSSLHVISRAIDLIVDIDQNALNLVDEYNSMISSSKSSGRDNHYFYPPFILGLSRYDSSTIPAELARVGRFEKMIEMTSPSEHQREIILESLLKSMIDTPTKTIHLSSLGDEVVDDEDEEKDMIRQWATILAPQTAGCVAADLRRICADALIQACTRQLSSMSTHLILTWPDICESARNCVPSQLAKMDISMTRFVGDKDVLKSDGTIDYKKRFQMGWEMFAGYKEMKKRIYRAVVGPWIRYRTMETNVQDMDDNIPCGVLFHGPSGCGKTVAAHCLASSLGLHIIKVKASDILDQWLGGSEAAIRSVFARARSAAPCVLFFDEIDALATNREDDEVDSSDVHSRVLSTLLNEMDGVSKEDSSDTNKNIIVVAATNRLNAIDAALLRPGRLQEHVLIDLPTYEDCLDILNARVSGWYLDDDVDKASIVENLVENKASCANIDGLCREACLRAIRRSMQSFSEENTSTNVSQRDFVSVLSKEFVS